LLNQKELVNKSKATS